jgi:hypothetical protein
MLHCSREALAQLPASPEAVMVEGVPDRITTMPRPAWLDAVAPAPAVTSENSHTPNNAGMLVSRNKTLSRATQWLEGILVRDYAGHFFLICQGQDAATATWERVQLSDHTQLGDIESGATVRVTGTWDESSSLRGHSAFRVQHVETVPPGGRR